MEIYRLETTVIKEGKIILSRTIEKIFTHRVERIIEDKTEKKSKKKLNNGNFDLLSYNKITYENRFYINNLEEFLNAHITNCYQKF